MKKFVRVVCCIAIAAAVAAGTSYAEGAESSISRVYLGGNLSVNFKDFSYSDSNASKSNDKSLSDIRYDAVAGYRLGSRVRAEAQYMVMTQNSFKTNSTDSTVEYKSRGVFANLIFDFWDMQEACVTPFIGAGAGVGSPNLNVSYKGIKDEVNKNGFSWQLQGGMNIKIMKSLMVNVKYTYLSLPNVKINSSSIKDIKAELSKGVQAIGVGLTVLI
ncbi:MAG: porin family protein [Endomicrobium sp.]|jgi:opacity protein-like surface antigen|nr:porin family protein [Endomicrobium sp.]